MNISIKKNEYPFGEYGYQDILCRYPFILLSMSYVIYIKTFLQRDKVYILSFHSQILVST